LKTQRCAITSRFSENFRNYNTCRLRAKLKCSIGTAEKGKEWQKERRNSPTRRRSTSRRVASWGRKEEKRKEKKKKKNVQHRTKQEFRLKFRNERPSTRTRGNEWMLQVYCTVIPYTRRRYRYPRCGT